MEDEAQKKITSPPPAPAINMNNTSSTLGDLSVIVEIRPQAKDQRANPELLIVCFFFALIR